MVAVSGDSVLHSEFVFVLGEVAKAAQCFEVPVDVFDVLLTVQLEGFVVVLGEPAALHLGVAQHDIRLAGDFDLGVEFTVHIHVL